MILRNVRNLFTLVLGLSILFYELSCSQVAYTGRNQLALIPSSQLVTMSATEYQKVLGEGKISSDKKNSELIKRVGLKIQKAVEQYMASQNRTAELEGYNWEFNLLDDPNTVNAWCMPGGKVAFYTGILPICQSETGVAVVMGHEVAHAIANHGRERMSQQMIAQFGLSALSGATDGSTYGPLLQQAVGVGTNLGMLKFSRDHESEADHLGIVFMAMAGYDPNEAPKFWQRMPSGGGQMEFLSTHPSHDTRVADLNNWVAEANSFYKKN